MITVFNTKQTFNFIKDVNDITEARINIVQVVGTVGYAVNDLKESIQFGQPVNQSFKQIGQVESSLVNAMTMCINLKSTKGKYKNDYSNRNLWPTNSKAKKGLRKNSERYKRISKSHYGKN